MVEPLLPGHGAVRQPGPGRRDDLPGIPGGLPGGLGGARGPGDGADPPRGARAGGAAGGRRAVEALVVSSAGRGAAPPGPSLDFNPVAWREWHRARPSRMMRVAWGLYAALGLLWVYGRRRPSNVAGPMRDEVVGLMNGFQVSLGLLLLSVGASASLAEERRAAALMSCSRRRCRRAPSWPVSGGAASGASSVSSSGRLGHPCSSPTTRILGGLRAAARPGTGLRRGDHQPGPGGGDVGRAGWAVRSRCA